MSCSTASRTDTSSKSGVLVAPPGALGVNESDIGRSEARNNVYVVRLRREVFSKRKFRRANPDYAGNGLCLYVGMTGLTPEKRLQKHKAGGMVASYWVEQYGQGLIPRFYQELNPMSRETAKEVEESLAEYLRGQGHATWQN